MVIVQYWSTQLIMNKQTHLTPYILVFFKHKAWVDSIEIIDKLNRTKVNQFDCTSSKSILRLNIRRCHPFLQVGTE